MTLDSESPLARLALTAPTILYRSGVAARNWLFDAGMLRRARLPVPVISVGNITVGGTGKTPLVSEIVRHLSGRALRAAVLTRGYGRQRRGRGAGPIVLRSGPGPGVSGGAVLLDPSTADSRVTGDEPLMLARQNPGVPIVIGTDRRETGRLAVEQLGAQAVLLDDGFQHRWLARDLDIVVLDSYDPFGHFRLLPSGRLREPLSSLGRADVLVVTRAPTGDPLQTLQDVVRRHNAGAPCFRASQRPVSLVPISGGAEIATSSLAGKPVAAFCGIGNPESFRSGLLALDAPVVRFDAFRDHFSYTIGDVTRLLALARRAGAACLVTTEKDATRIDGAALEPAPPGRALPILVLRIRCEIEEGEAFFKLLDRVALAGHEGVQRSGRERS